MTTIPNGVTVTIAGNELTAKGPKGSVTKKFSGKLKLEQKGSELVVSAKAEEKALLGTADAVLRCMFLGVTEGYSKKMKALYAHFPITLEVKGREIIIKNFLGEKSPRVAQIAGDATKVEAKAQLVSVSGPDKEGVGQTCANLRAAVKIREKDPRVFQDGLFEVAE